MNEENLKNLWQAEGNAPTIDFARVEKLSKDWRKRLRRKVTIEIWVQISATIATIISVFFYPKLIFLSLIAIALCLWYVPELRGLYKTESGEPDHLPAKDFLILKVRIMKNFFRRTRIVTYGVVPLALPVAYYGLNILDNLSITTSGFIRSLIFTLIICQILIVIVTEIYFKILYKPALKELKNLLQQLDSEEERAPICGNLVSEHLQNFINRPPISRRRRNSQLFYFAKK